MPATPPCPGNPKGGHWWICEDSTGRFSNAYCKLCPAVRKGEDSFSNTFDEATAEYGYLDDVPQTRRKKRMKREPGTSLTADERSKRHIFYEAHKVEIIAVYKKLKGNVKATAQELSKQWKVELPSTTLHGLLQRWEVEKRKPEKPKRKKLKGKKAERERILVKAEPPLWFWDAEVVALEQTDKGMKATLLFSSSADLRLGTKVKVTAA